MKTKSQKTISILLVLTGSAIVSGLYGYVKYENSIEVAQIYGLGPLSWWVIGGIEFGTPEFSWEFLACAIWWSIWPSLTAILIFKYWKTQKKLYLAISSLFWIFCGAFAFLIVTF